MRREEWKRKGGSLGNNGGDPQRKGPLKVRGKEL